MDSLMILKKEEVAVKTIVKLLSRLSNKDVAQILKNKSQKDYLSTCVHYVYVYVCVCARV